MARSSFLLTLDDYGSALEPLSKYLKFCHSLKGLNLKTIFRTTIHKSFTYNDAPTVFAENIFG